jgi:chemotaxis protein MotA
LFVLIGAVVIIGSIVAGYTMHGGQLLILFQITEFIIIGGAAIGSMLISNPFWVTKKVFSSAIQAMKGNKITRATYEELLRAMYQLMQLVRRDGLVALEPHFENPKQSTIFQKAPALMANHHARDFLCDTLRTVVGGSTDPHDLEELMDKDLEILHAHETKVPTALATVGDSLPGLGIVAAVLGVVITMGKIDQPPAVIGHSVAAALVGTFLGILLCYGFVGPLAKNLENQIEADGRYLNCIKAALLSFSKGPAPQVVIEYARRTIAPDERPSFEAVEKMLKKG